jgi:uroporphyrinogen decarboxylase
METTPEIVTEHANRLLDSMEGLTGHVMNLGHGIAPSASIENVEALVAAVRARGER